MNFLSIVLQAICFPITSTMLLRFVFFFFLYEDGVINTKISNSGHLGRESKRDTIVIQLHGGDRQISPARAAGTDKPVC